MLNKSTINFSTILKRSTCVNSICESVSVDAIDRLFNIAVESVEKSKNGKEYLLENNLKAYLEAIGNTDSATKCYWGPLKILSDLNKKEFVNAASRFNCLYVTKVLPYVEDTKMVVNDLDRFALTNEQKEYIKDYADKYYVADRILSNYNSLSKTFNLESTINRYQVTGLKSFVDSCAYMIDTYNVKDYQKMNITLEEVDYILSKEGIKYDKSDMVKYVVEYFLSRSAYLTDKDLDNFKRVLTENRIVSENELSKVKFLFENNTTIDSVESGINWFLTMKSKTPESLSESIVNILENSSKNDVLYNSSKITSLLWELTKNAVFESDQDAYKCNSILTNYVTENANNEIFDKDDVGLIIDSLKESVNSIRLSANSNPDYAKSSVEFINQGLIPCIESLEDLKDILYDKNNLETIKNLNEVNSILALSEFKIFKFHNLIRAAFNLDKFLKVKERRLIDNGKNKVSKFMKKAKNVLFGEAVDEHDILKYVGEDQKASLVVRQYFFEESEVDMDKISGFLKESCSEFNDILTSQNYSCRTYYTINPGIAEIRIKEPMRVEVSESEILNNLDESIDSYLDEIGACDSLISGINIPDYKTLDENIDQMYASKFSMEQFSMVVEAMSIIGYDKSDVEKFAEAFIDYNFNRSIIDGMINESYLDLSKLENQIHNIVENYKIIEESNFGDKLEAYGYMQSIFEYSFPDSVDYDDDDEDEEDEEEEKKDKKPEVKKPKVGGAVNKKDEKDDKKEEPDKKDEKLPPLDKPKGKMAKAQVNLNSIKLGLQGLKAKFKDLNTKQKEATQNLDNAARAFTTATKNALVSDRREAIIKGSVIPSFSRCIKASILLAGVAHFSLPAAVIGALGALAISAKLTRDERLLLLDEIETELEVVDKELQIADSNNQTNKYRELLKYKKNLQRQYQRIRYNIRVGKDILPGSAGMPEI